MTAASDAIVKSIIADQFCYPEDELDQSTHLYDEIGMDSAALVEFAVRIESSVMIKVRSFEKCETVGDIFNYVAAEMSKQR